MLLAHLGSAGIGFMSAPLQAPSNACKGCPQQRTRIGVCDFQRLCSPASVVASQPSLATRIRFICPYLTDSAVWIGAVFFDSSTAYRRRRCHSTCHCHCPTAPVGGFGWVAESLCFSLGLELCSGALRFLEQSLGLLSCYA